MDEDEDSASDSESDGGNSVETMSDQWEADSDGTFLLIRVSIRRLILTLDRPQPAPILHQQTCPTMKQTCPTMRTTTELSGEDPQRRRILARPLGAIRLMTSTTGGPCVKALPHSQKTPLQRGRQLRPKCLPSATFPEVPKTDSPACSIPPVGRLSRALRPHLCLCAMTG